MAGLYALAADFFASFWVVQVLVCTFTPFLECGCLIKARLPPTLVFCIIYYNDTTRRSTEQNRCLPSVLFLRALHHCITDEQASARQLRTPARRHRA